MKTDVVSIGEESYQIIASNPHCGRVINRTIRRSDAIELLAYYHQYRAMQQKDPSAMHRGLMEGTGNRLQSIGAKRVAGGDLYQLPFELTEEEKASLSATKEQMAQSFKRAFPPPYARAAA